MPRVSRKAELENENGLLRHHFARIVTALQQVANDWHIRRDIRPAIDAAEQVLQEAHQARVDLGIPAYVRPSDQDYVL